MVKFGYGQESFSVCVSAVRVCPEPVGRQVPELRGVEYIGGNQVRAGE